MGKEANRISGRAAFNGLGPRRHCNFVEDVWGRLTATALTGCSGIGRRFVRAVTLAGIRPVSGVSHGMDQREVVDEIGVGGRFVGVGGWALFHGYGWFVCFLIAAAGPTFARRAGL